MATFIVDPATFASAIMMSSAPRLKFQTDQQEVTTNGEKKWTASVAVSYVVDPNGIQSPAEVLNISVAGEDPGVSCPPGTSVTFEQLRVGVSGVEQRERKDGSGMRVVGGKMFASAKAIKAATAAPSWQSKKDNAA